MLKARKLALLLFKNFTRNLHKHLAPKYDLKLAKEIEEKWLNKLETIQKSYSENMSIRKDLKKKYVLSMFPYPSGRLHLGHVRVYTTSDILARYNRMSGHYVIHPIGWDSFGLPAENAAIERNLKPEIWTQENISYMKNQLKQMSFSFDWNRELSTCDPSYYKWTQYLFLELYKNRIIYQKEAVVNWDPVDKTVLANEQINEQGRSWRSGAKVEKKILKQWFFKSSIYADSLNKFENLNADDWKIIKKIQSKWIGNCNGCFVDFNIETTKSKGNSDFKLSVFTEEPFGLYGLSHIIVSKNNLLIKYLNSSYEENEFLDCVAINPLTKEKVPIFLNSSEDYGELKGDGEPHMSSKLIIPSLHKDYKKFVQDKKLCYKEIFDEEKSVFINSNDINNLSDKQEAFERITKLLKEHGCGYKTSLKLNDWCISRQRKWGTPIPLIICETCNVVPLPYDQLPLKFDHDLEKENEKIYETKCPKCQKKAHFEKDTMDTFVDSSWYYFRYLDSKNEKIPFDYNIINKEMPVDIYIGGSEHAMTHLFVSRLITHFLNDQKKINFKEPFSRFLAMGMVRGESFKKKNGKYISPNDVEKINDKYYEKTSKELVIRDFEKMSKSKLNGVDPSFMIDNYGIDFTRLFLANFVNPRSDRDFSLSMDMIKGNTKIFDKIWKLVVKINKFSTDSTKEKTQLDLKKIYEEIYDIRNKQLAAITYNLNDAFNIPFYLTAVSKLVNYLDKVKENDYNEVFMSLFAETLISIAPVIPNFTCECWDIIKDKLPSKFDKEKSIVEQKWPEIDPNWKIDLFVNFNGSKIKNNYYLLNKDCSTFNIEKAKEFIKTNQIDKKLNIDSNYSVSITSNYPLNTIIKINLLK